MSWQGIKRSLQQTAVWWDHQSIDKFGLATFLTGAEVKCRWNGKRVRFINPEGEEEISQAGIMVNFSIKTGDFLYLGQLADFASSADLLKPYSLTNVFQVKGILKIPTTRARTFYREAMV